MGNDISIGKNGSKTAQYGNLFIQTDKSTYFGGDTVTGKIYLNLLMPYPGNQLFLQLKGKEYSSFIQTKSEMKTVQKNGTTVNEHQDVDELFEERNEVIKIVVPLYSWSVLIPGQYTIPFAFLLPSDLPSSFHQEGHKYIADISYRLDAILEPSFKGQPKLKYKQLFVVRQPIKSAMQGVGNEVRTNISVCCSQKGSNVVRAKFEKNYYSPGEAAQVVMQLDNTQCQANNTALVFSLKQKLTLKAKGKEEEKKFTKVKRDLPGVPAGGASDSNFIAINLPPFQGGDYNSIKTLNYMEHLKSLKDNNDVLNSATKSKLIQSEYSLEVSCPMEGCCAQTPTISCPIEIYYPEIQLPQVQPPLGWAPQEIGLVNLSLSGPSVQLSSGSGQVNVNLNVDPLAMVTNTMAAMGTMAANAGLGGHVQVSHSENVSTNPSQNVTFEVNNQMPAQNVTFEVNQMPAQNVTFEVNNQMPAQMVGNENFNFTVNTQASGNQFEHQSENGNFQATFKMN